MVIGDKKDTDLPITIERSNYYANIIRRAVAGETSKRVLTRLESGKDRVRIVGKIALRKNFESRMNVGDPASFVSGAFRQMLREAGVEVKGSASGASLAPRAAVKLVSYESAPLGDVIYGLNRYSNNFMAEMLVRSMGGIVAGPPGTLQKGVGVIRDNRKW